MASSKFFILEKEGSQYDAIIQSLDKQDIGTVTQHDAPVGNYLKCNLNGYWIISEEDYKKLKQIKKHE